MKARFSRERKSNTRQMAIRFLIISEDKKSSVDYFKAIIQAAQEACEGSEVVGIDPKTVVKGCGMGTRRLLEEAKSIRQRAVIPFDRYWLVFDKDDFLDFTEAICEAQKEDFQVAWSNECFELWYLLHFRYQNTPITREKCLRALEQEIQQRGKSSFRYSKGCTDMYALLQTCGSRADAERNAVKLRASYSDTHYSSHNPCTCVDLLLRELTDPEERKRILHQTK